MSRCRRAPARTDRAVADSTLGTARRCLSILAAAALTLAACGDSTDPGTGDPLAGLDELAIYGAAVDHLGLLDHTEEPNANLRQAVDWPAGPFQAGWFGTTLEYRQGVGWAPAEDRPAVAPDEVRVVWYQFVGQSVSLPLTERGHIDLVDLGDPGRNRLRVRILEGGTTEVANYVLHVGASETAAARSSFVQVDGSVGTATRQLQIAMRQDESESLTSGDLSSSQSVSLTESGFTYTAAIEADSAATGTATARIAAAATLDGATTRVELDLTEGVGGAVSGTGVVLHAGVRIADVAITGAQLEQLQMTFTRPDGGSFTAAQRSRLGNLVVILLTPADRIQTYFS